VQVHGVGDRAKSDKRGDRWIAERDPADIEIASAESPSSSKQRTA